MKFTALQDFVGDDGTQYVQGTTYTAHGFAQMQEFKRYAIAGQMQIHTTDQP
jgi:hypothetical protein